MRSLAFWVFCLFGSKVVSATGCNADNCLRALFPTQSPAVYSSDAAFCATYTKTVNTQTTGFPSKASAACGTAPARYSSACSCKPTLASTVTTSTTTSTSRTTPSPTSTSTSTTSSSTTTSSTTTTTSPACTATRAFGDVVRNGGFECGLAPWISQSLPGNSYTITSPGDASTFAYEFDQTGPVSPSTNQNPAFLTQDIGAVNGVPYNLRFRTYFDKCTGDEGFIGVKINNQPVYTVDACDGPAATFNDNLVQFFAPADGSTNVRFEFLIGTTPAVVKIDNVSAIPLH